MKRRLVLASLAIAVSLGLTGCGGGSSSTQTSAPSIADFAANPSTIASGSSATLAGVFANGTGVITPGNLPVTDKLLGMNMAIWYDLVSNQTGIVNAFQSAGITQVRWPGGSDSDLYHWQTNFLCDGGYSDSNDTFTNFVSDMAKPAKLDVALTANYGSNATCTAGGDPSEAANWATAALVAGITPSHMTVGNEEYGSWEYDLHSTKNDPTLYAAAVVGTDRLLQFDQDVEPEHAGRRRCRRG